MDGKYLYNMVLKLVDYCGDIKAGTGQYHQMYSPNNIRRLVLSPDGAHVRYHISVKGRLFGNVQFNGELAYKCSLMEDYAPMIGVLYADRICASIEEVVICTKSMSSGGFTLDTRELDFNSLIKSYKAGGSSLKETIMSRYKRLHAFIIYQGTIQDFLQDSKDGNKATTVLSSVLPLQKCNIEYFHKGDWFDGYGTSAQFYALDRVGSPLNGHFKEVQMEMAKLAKLKAISESKKEKSSVDTDAFDKEYKKAKQVVRGYQKLLSLANSGYSIYAMITEKEGVSIQDGVLRLKVHDSLGKRIKGVEPLNPDGASELDIVKYNTEACKAYSFGMYYKLVEELLSRLSSLNTDYPLITREVMESCDRVIKIPPDLEGLQTFLPIKLAGERWVDCVVNLFCMLNILAYQKNDMKDKEDWSKVVLKEG